MPGDHAASLIENARGALARGDLFDAIADARRAIDNARAADDPAGIADACPILRDARECVIEIAARTEDTHLVEEASSAHLAPGCSLVQPPLIGADARALREMLERRAIPALVVCREPMTRAGQWPVVAVGQQLVVRTRVDPPAGVSPGGGMTHDTLFDLPPAEWFLEAHRALGDAALAEIDPAEPAWFRMDDALDRLDALPDHAGLIDTLENICREAASEPKPTRERRRGLDDPYSF